MKCDTKLFKTIFTPYYQTEITELNMYNTSTFSKSTLVALAASLALTFTSSAFAGHGKGKPGINPIKPGGNIVEIAMEANALLGEFDYLLAAVGCLTDAEGNNAVIDLLTGSDKYTLFAPTDTAFENLQLVLGIAEPAPEKTCLVDDVLGPGTLFTVLAYHVAEGRRFSNSVFNRNNNKEIEMLTGEYYITTTPELQIIDGFPQVAAPLEGLYDINASNGVIHTINTVLLPFNPL